LTSSPAGGSAVDDPAAVPPHLVRRRLLSHHLTGSGVELGPGHQPFELPHAGTTVRYVDRWHPEENRTLFPELGDRAPFPVPDVVANFDTDRLQALADGSQDFVIASHVLEHLAEPLGFTQEIHRVVRVGGIALILLPDRHRTFDRARHPTSLHHLISEQTAGITEVDDAHIREYLEMTGTRVQGSEEEIIANLDLHRRRSIHVHCWDHDEFAHVLEYCIGTLGERWEFADGILANDIGPAGFEFGYVLRKAGGTEDPASLQARFSLSWGAWRDARLLANAAEDTRPKPPPDLSDALAVARGEVDQMRMRADEADARAVHLEADLGRIRSTIAYRAYRRGVRLLRGERQTRSRADVSGSPGVGRSRA
jgi:SAM-dependent methyltransferase